MVKPKSHPEEIDVFIVHLPISDVQADMAGAPASVVEQIVRAIGRPAASGELAGWHRAEDSDTDRMMAPTRSLLNQRNFDGHTVEIIAQALEPGAFRVPHASFPEDWDVIRTEALAKAGRILAALEVAGMVVATVTPVANISPRRT
jgi:hypothetical protein